MNRPSASVIKKIIIMVSIGITLGLGISYLCWQSSFVRIADFNEAEDRAPLVKLFHDNWYWLISSPDYSLEFMLKHRAPNRNPQYFGQLDIKVLRKDGEFIGFTAYYMKSPQEGTILWVAVNKEFRGKRYAEQLMRFAMNALKKKGAQYIKLVTRTTNFSAQSLYKRLGFVETNRDDEYVFFSYYF